MNISQEAIKISQEAERVVLHNYTPSAGLVQKKNSISKPKISVT